MPASVTITRAERLGDGTLRFYLEDGASVDFRSVEHIDAKAARAFRDEDLVLHAAIAELRKADPALSDPSRVKRVAAEKSGLISVVSDPVSKDVSP